MGVLLKINQIKEDVERLATLGYSKNTIAKELNIKPCTFYYWINNYKELENAYNNGLRKRKEICRTIDVSNELYEVAKVLVDNLIETYGEDKVNKDFHLGLNYGYLMGYLNNTK